jgi:hypothetical protein
MTRRLLLFAVPIIVVPLGVGGWLLWPRPGITRANVEQIHDGMTREAVEELLGGPPGDYRTPGSRHSQFEIQFGYPGNSTLEQWDGDQGLVLVAFNQQGLVVAHRFYETPSDDESLFEKIRRLLRL